MAYSAASAKSTANRFCQARGYASAGGVRSFKAPAGVAVHDAATKAARPAGSPAFSGIECVPAGYLACKPDANQNVGVGNVGRLNFGNRNRGSANVGSKNAGSGCIGDSNQGSGESREILHPGLVLLN